jgi:uncharacterized membrane protein
VTGLATLFPVAVTIAVVVVIFQFADRFLGRAFGLTSPGLGIVVTVAVIFIVGILSVHFFGRVLFQAIEGLLSRLPIIRKVYPAVKQLASFLFSEGGKGAAFSRVVLVQFPRAGAWSIAFVTNEAQTSMTGQQVTMLTLLIPTPPSPFTGPIVFVPEPDVVQLDLTVEDAIKLVVSGGVVAPPLQAATRQP